MIPRKIIQTWKSRTMSVGLDTLCSSWRTHNQDYEYQLYDDKECAELIMNFDFRTYYAYEQLIPGAFKADLWRVCYLYIHGGIYADIDTMCLSNLDNFIDESNFVAAIDLDGGTSAKHYMLNAFIACEPESKIMKSCIEMIINNVENKRINLKPLDFTACGVLGKAVNLYLNRNENSSFENMEGHINQMHLLKFHKKTEYISDIDGNILLQNKNGNHLIQRVYEKELRDLNIIHWYKADTWIEDKTLYS